MRASHVVTDSKKEGNGGRMTSLLGRYFTARVMQMVLAVFVTTFGMVFIVDFVEMLRRTADLPGVSAGFVAYLSLLRVPAAAEQLMPFCVLSGAMAAFLDLSRKLELLVARAAGVSAWGFLTGPILFAAFFGIFATGLMNPLFAATKSKGDAIEAQLFSGRTPGTSDQRIWIRQKSIDGQAILKAEKLDESGTVLSSVAAYVYDENGRFQHEIDAATGRLLDGVWQFDHARILTPGEDAADVGAYLLATNLTPSDLTRGMPAPDCVPFWQLPAFIHSIDAAGLDSTAYRLQYQTLLARPLMLIAMVLVAAAFSLRFFRFGGISKMVGGAMGAGFVLYVATKMVGDLGQTGLIGAGIAAWSPPLVGSLLATLALLHQEDG
jgi:lipopolysaccharide export system permease protein